MNFPILSFDDLDIPNDLAYDLSTELKNGSKKITGHKRAHDGRMSPQDDAQTTQVDLRSTQSRRGGRRRGIRGGKNTASAGGEGHLVVEMNRPTNGEIGLSKNLRAHLDEVNRQRLVRAINQCVPTKQGERNDKLFRLARCLLAIGCSFSLEDRITIFGYWWNLSKDKVGTKYREVSLADFLRASELARDPLDPDSFLETCFLKCKEQPFPRWAEEDSHECQLLAALCRELQRATPGKDFFLSVRTVEKLIGISKTHASTCLNLFCTLGKMQLIEKGEYKTRKASSYRYIAPDLHDSS